MIDLLKTSDNFRRIIDLDKQGQTEEALKIFENVLVDLKSTGRYSLQNWQLSLRKIIYDFGAQVKSSTPNRYTETLEKYVTEEVESEIYWFIKSEIVINYFIKKEVLGFLKTCIEKYPENPEFRMSYGTYISPGDSESEEIMLESIEQLKFSHRLEPTNEIILNALARLQYSYIDHLIESEKYKIAEDFVLLIINEKVYITDQSYPLHNGFVSLQMRCRDHSLFLEKMERKEREFLNKMERREGELSQKINDNLDIERRKTIEILAFFSAIIAFILTTVSIGKNFTFREFIYSSLSIGIVLVTFVLAIVVLFRPTPNEIRRDPSFWLLIAILIMFLILAVVR